MSDRDRGDVPAPPRRIFRPEALERYARGRATAVFPVPIASRVFALLWALVALAAVALALISLARVPVYAPVTAIVIANDGPDRIGGTPLVVVFLPPQDRDRVEAGQSVFIWFGPGNGRVRRTITVVDPEVHDRATLQQRFGLTDGVAAAISEPAGVALAPLAPTPASVAQRAWLGGVRPAEVTVGSRRLLSLIPVVGRWVKD